MPTLPLFPADVPLPAPLTAYDPAVALPDFAARVEKLRRWQAEIAAYTAVLAAPNLTDALRKQSESKLRRANDRKDNLTERGAARSGVPAFLAGIDAEQLATQVAVLTAA